MTTLDTATARHARELLASMILLRRFEERCAEVYSAQKIRGFLHLYVGEEAIAVGAIPQLRADDAIVSTYREHGHAIVRGVPPEAVMAEMYGKANGCAGGRGGSMHLFDVPRRFYGGYAIVAGGIPVAVGLGLAEKMQRRDRVVACFFGDGATDEGAYHESLNLAALWRIPVLFLCENNLYAMGTALARHAAETDLTREPAAHGIASISIDGMDVLAVEEATRAAIADVRASGRPRFLELRTYRFRAHSMYDAEKYREKAEVERWKARDPITTFAAKMRTEGALDDAILAAIEADCAARVDAAVRAADEGPLEPTTDLTKHVYAPSAPR